MRLASTVGWPSLSRGLTTKLVAFWAPAGAQLVGPVAVAVPAAPMLQRLTVTSPENSALVSEPAVRPAVPPPSTSVVFCRVSEATRPLSPRSSPELM